MKLLPPSTNPNQQPGAPNVPYFKALIETVTHKRNLPVDRRITLELREWQLINTKLRDIFCQHHIEVTFIDTIADISNLFTGRMDMIEKSLFTNKL